MRKYYLKFLWRAPIERVCIAILLVVAYFLMNGLNKQQDKNDRLEDRYNQCLIDRMAMRDSLRVHYNNIIEADLRTRIAEYDKLIHKLKNDEKRK